MKFGMNSDKLSLKKVLKVELLIHYDYKKWYE